MMNVNLKIKRHPKISILIAILVALLLGFILRGWLRTTVIPSYYSSRYSTQLNSIIKDENTKLHYPLKALGMQDSGDYPAKCNLDTAQAIEVDVYCSATQNGLRHIKETSELASFSQQVQIVNKSLLNNGWSGGLETKLSPPPAMLTPPIGWYSYSTMVKGYFCSFQFSSGDMGGIDGGGMQGTLFCSREGHFF